MTKEEYLNGKDNDKQKFDDSILELKKWYHRHFGFTEEEIENINYDKVSLELDTRIPARVGNSLGAD